MRDRLRACFEAHFSHPAKYLFSAPGRTELGGNHTDHQHGCVLAAAVNLETVAAVAENGKAVIRVQSEGYPLCEIRLDNLDPDPAEYGTTAALIRGIAAAFPNVRGFDAYVVSTVLPGSGLSSSAAFEVLIGTICNTLFDERRKDAVEIARIGQAAENTYFGKPCGLMDQTACAVGGIIGIDFFDPDQPIVTKVPLDLACYGYALCIIDSGANHANLTGAYASIPEELETVCACFGKNVLRDIPENDFYSHISEVRTACGDRAVLRSMHFFRENERARLELQALQRGDFAAFLKLVRESGRSSWMLLQNVIAEGETAHQELAFSLALAEQLLGGTGAVRVHGGGFAGTMQAFVPTERVARFKRDMEAVLGAGSCHVLSFRQAGGILEETL